jgi:hypothetical protein
VFNSTIEVVEPGLEVLSAMKVYTRGCLQVRTRESVECIPYHFIIDVGIVSRNPAICPVRCLFNTYSPLS